MKFTVKEALKLDSLKGSEVVGGKKGLDNELRFVNVMEVPDITDWISGYEMILTTGYPYRDNDTDWGKLIEDLKMKKLSAFSIKIDRYINEIPKDVIDMGNKLNIPIIKLPIEARFDLIINDIMREIINKDYIIIKKSQSIHENFSEVVLSGGGLEKIVDILSRITNHIVIIEDIEKNILAESLGYRYIKNKKDEKPKVVKRSIVIYDKVESYIKLISVDKEILKEDIMALERARDAAAMILLNEKGKKEIEKKYRNDFLNDVIKGEFKSYNSLLERGRFFDIEIKGSYLLFLLEIENLDSMFSKEMKKKKLEGYDLLSNAFNLIFKSFFSSSEESIVWSIGKNIFVLYPIKNENENLIKNISIEIAENIKSKVDKYIKEFNISIGIGRYYRDILDINKSYNEAEEALKIGKMIKGYSEIYHYDDIGAYNILMRGSTKLELKEFLEQKLGKLIDYDNKNNSELLITLEKILNNDCNMKSTSEEMFLHHKTILYRKKQIEDILGISLNNTEEKFSIYMALKIKKFL